jgi:signal transduction histidine kinase
MSGARPADRTGAEHRRPADGDDRGTRGPRRSPLRSIRFRVTAGAVLVVGAALTVGALAVVALLQSQLVTDVRAQVDQDLVVIGQRVDLEGTDVIAEYAEDDQRLVRVQEAPPRIEVPATPPPRPGPAGGSDDDDGSGDDGDDDDGGDDDVDDDDASAPAVVPTPAPTPTTVPGPTPDPVLSAPSARDLPVPPIGEAVETRVDGRPYLVAASGTEADRVLVVARSLREEQEATAATGRLLAIGVPLAVLLVGIVVWAVVSRALAPVERMRREVDGIGGDALDRRIAVPGSADEIDRLARTLNGMLARAEQSQLTQRRFVSDASHELRSPIATIRQHAEVARAHPDATAPGELADIVLAEGVRMQDLVEQLLLLARLDEHRAITRTAAVDLDDLALAEVRRLAAFSRITVDGAGIAPVRVTGDERLLARALRNLTDNALRHAATRVSVSTALSAGTAVVTVDDDGPGIPSDRREQVFERFARLDDSRARDSGGTGLGLAISREIVEAHGGSLRIDDAPMGGARLRIELPADPA